MNLNRLFRDKKEGGVDPPSFSSYKYLDKELMILATFKP